MKYEVQKQNSSYKFKGFTGNKRSSIFSISTKCLHLDVKTTEHLSSATEVIIWFVRKLIRGEVTVNK